MSKSKVTLPNMWFYTLHQSLAIMNDLFQENLMFLGYPGLNELPYYTYLIKTLEITEQFLES